MITTKFIMEELKKVSSIKEDNDTGLSNPGDLATLVRAGSNIHMMHGNKTYKFPVNRDKYGMEVCDVVGKVVPTEGTPDKKTLLALVNPTGLPVRILDNSVFDSATEIAKHDDNEESPRPFDTDKTGGQFVGPNSLPRFTEPDMPDSESSQLNKRVNYVKNTSLFGPHAPEFDPTKEY